MKSGFARACARLLTVGLVLAASAFLGAAQKPDDLSDIDWRLLEKWHAEGDPFPKPTLQDFYRDAWYQGEGARQETVAKETAERPAPKTAQETAFVQLLAEAQTGNARAQFALGEIYDQGKLVPRDTALAFRWWYISARQGFRAAEHNIGVAYLVGIGVAPNREEAIKWFTKAAELGDSVAGQYAQRLKAGQTAAPTQVMTGPPGTRDEEFQDPVSSVNAAKPENSENERILAGIVKEYAKNHTYLAEDMYVCVDMANDVWNQVTTKGIKAKVMIGNVHAEMESLLDANHAWVLAEASPGKWVALEATGGILVYDNPRYFQGHAFSNPKEIREYQALVREYNEAVKKYNAAATDYNQALVAYQNSSWFARANIEVELFRRQTIVSERKEDVAQVSSKLLALLNGPPAGGQGTASTR